MHEQNSVRILIQNSPEDFRQAGELKNGTFPAQLRNSAIVIIHSQLRKQEHVHGILKRERMVNCCCSSSIPVLITIITIPGHFLR